MAAFPPALGFSSAINTTGSGVEIPRLTLRQIVTVPLSSGTVTFGISKFTVNTVRGGEGQADKMEEKSEREEDRGRRKKQGRGVEDVGIERREIRRRRRRRRRG